MEPDRLVDNGGITTKIFLPEFMAQNNDSVVPLQSIIG